jgi:hypothetical protein
VNEQDEPQRESYGDEAVGYGEDEAVWVHSASLASSMAASAQSSQNSSPVSSNASTLADMKSSSVQPQRAQILREWKM